MTRAQIVDLARAYLQESGLVPLTVAIANDLANEAQADLAELAEYATATFTVTGGLVLNQHDYDISGTSLLTVWSVAANDASGNLTPLGPPLSLAEMDSTYSSWRTDAAGRPGRWWFQANALWVHPKPSAAYAGTPLQLKGPYVPADMSADGVSPIGLPARFHRTLAKYIAYRWLAIDKENPSAQRMAAFWQGDYRNDVRRLRGLIGGRAGMDSGGLRLDPGRPTDTSSLLGDE